ncbi:MAG: hypothetical protein JWO30_1853 [Fibrobacteres bacterium]|nr:hypothetical protein [Fibrobacterota bacterium]
MLYRLPKSRLASELVRLFPKSFTVEAAKAARLCRLETTGGKGFRITPGDGEILIEAAGTDILVWALGELMAMDKPKAVEKTPALAFRGIMLDASRNAVPRVDFLKDRIACLALMGLNRFCLYTEDTYPVKGEPLFGYARGAYSQAELRELVEYGRLWGVTLFPCIQTLGHMEHILKYPHYTPIKDNDMIYNVYSEEAYAFIEKTIEAARAPYDTDFIHIGMDETHGLGRGLAFKEGEPIHPRKLYVEHLGKVAAICRKLGLKPAMWGDIVLGTTGEHKMDASETSLLPADVTMNYWEYAWCDTEKYAKNLAEFKGMGYDPIVSPGVWSWSRFFPAYYKAQANISTLLGSAKRVGVQGALNTHWGDDGHECFFDWNLPAHAYFLAQCTETENVDETARRKFSAVFGEDFDVVRSVEKIDVAGYKVESLLPYNVGKCFFYDDPAQGLFSGMKKVKPAGEFYRKTAAEMRAKAKRKTLFQPLFRFAEAFCDFLSVKADLRSRLAAAYKKKDRKALKKIAADIPVAKRKLAKVQDLYRAYWLRERNPFGLEIIDGRMGALSARLDYLQGIVGEYLAGKRPDLPELDFIHYSMFHESRGPDYQPSIWPDFMLHYSALASRNVIKWW